MKRNLLATTMLGALALQFALPASQAAADPETGGTLRILGTAEVDRFDTVPPATAVTGNFFRAVQRQLVSFKASDDPDEQIQPFGDLATDIPTPTDDGLTYTFTLRDGANWDAPDGARQITSADVARGFKRMCNPSLPSPSISFFDGLIEGVTEFCEGFADIEPTPEAMKEYIEGNDIAGIETPSDDTVIFRLTEAANDFIYLLTLVPASPAPIEVLDYQPDSPDYRENYIASGPYTVESYVPDSVVHLVRNPAWEAESDPLRNAYVDEIDVIAGVQADAAMQQLQSGDGDMLYDIPVPPVTVQMLNMQGDDKISAVAQGSSKMVWINTVSDNNDGALRNLKVREALAYAIDRAAVVQQFGGEEFASPLHGIMPAGVVGHHEFNLFPTPDDKGDPEKAKALLAEAGYPDGLTLKMPFRNLGSDPAVAQVIQAAFQEAGFTIELIPTPASDFYARLITNFENAQNGVWDLVPSGWSPDWPGGAARSIYTPQYTYDGTHGTFNFSDYNNPEATELAEQALVTTDLEESRELWEQVDEMVTADVPTIPLVSLQTVMYHGEDVENFLPYAAGGQGDWTNVWLDR
ncbi:ABC transporter substrate-binding protein [Tropicimonas sp. IMCC34011]|uniref:ABC transporter substrate-binding protein n=1 Tax=Tropicimonas sp. IMCC34011 TaxID=2248759 RepID=UPI0018E51CEF|nr:ABC transporter substrate-binding protein [Tropicimonas sp. IMCC34011]